MGIYSNAELVWGVPVLAWDENTGDATPFWDEEAEDWREFPDGIEVDGYGHYEDPDNTRGILTTKKIERYRADCWEPKSMTAKDLDVDSYQPQDVEQFYAAVEGLIDDSAPCWNLVATVG